MASSENFIKGNQGSSTQVEKISTMQSFQTTRKYYLKGISEMLLFNFVLVRNLSGNVVIFNV